jgi:hypothetical protein
MNLTNSLDQDIESRLQKVMVGYASDQENRYKIDSQLKHLYELRRLRSGVAETCQNSFEVMKTNHNAQCELFRMAASLSKSEEISRLQQQEFEQMTVYHDHLQRIIELMKVEQIQDWCEQLIEVSRVLAEAIAEQQEIQAKFEPLLDEQLGNEEIAELEREIEELIITNSQLLEDEAVLQCQVADAEEELFRLTQEVVPYKDINELDDMIICPVCNVNFRNCFLMTCGHPICRGCMEAAKATYECPICNTPFKEDSVRPFILE